MPLQNELHLKLDKKPARSEKEKRIKNLKVNVFF